MQISASEKRKHARCSGLGAVIGLLALVAALCTGAVANAASTEADAPAATAVSVRMTDFRLEMPTHLAPGTYTFNAMNAGQAPHALAINGPGVANQSSAVVQPGQTATLNVTLANGSYRFYCPVDSHAQMGMELTVTVS
jgi:plastocyanin